MSSEALLALRDYSSGSEDEEKTYIKIENLKTSPIEPSSSSKQLTKAKKRCLSDSDDDFPIKSSISTGKLFDSSDEDEDYHFVCSLKKSTNHEVTKKMKVDSPIEKSRSIEEEKKTCILAYT